MLRGVAIRNSCREVVELESASQIRDIIGGLYICRGITVAGKRFKVFFNDFPSYSKGVSVDMGEKTLNGPVFIIKAESDYHSLNDDEIQTLFNCKGNAYFPEAICTD